MPPDETGQGAEGDGRQVGDGPVQQHGRRYLDADRVAGAGGQGADQAEFGNPEAAGRDGEGGEQPDERERGQGRLPGDLGLGQPGGAQARQQDEPQGEVTGHGGSGDPPSARREQGAGPVAEA